MHGNNTTERFRRDLSRFEVRLFVPPERMIEIAAERTDGMADFYLRHSRRGVQGYDDLHAVVRSAYLQGVEDMLAVIRSGEVEELANGFADSQ